MADFVVVGGVPIKVSPSSGKADWNDAVDRRRSFDNTYRASATGGAARDWHFSTPPITRAVAGTYRAVLSQVQAQMCSGEGLELPTMCCAELIGETPVKGAASNYVSLDFALHESQSKRLLLKYAPGDTITGESFTRSTTAYYSDSTGVLVSAAINAKRDSHYPTVGGVRSILLEDTRTNLLLRSEQFDNASWSKTNITVTADSFASPTGAATADKVAATASAATSMTQSAVVAAASCTYTIYIHKGSGATDANVFGLRNTTTATDLLYVSVNYDTGVVSYIIGSTGATLTALGNNNWYRLTLTLTAGVTSGNTITAYACYTGGAETAGEYAYVWGAQLEAAAFASSYIPTTTAALARGADFYSLPYTPPPQEMTVYAKFVEGGTLQTGARIFEIGNAAGGNPKLTIFGSSFLFYDLYHHNGVASTDAALNVTPVIGNTVEVAGRLFGDGSTDITQSVNGGAATGSTPPTALALATAWAAQLVWLNSIGTSGGIGFTALQSFKIVAGTRSLAEMRAA